MTTDNGQHHRHFKLLLMKKSRLLNDFYFDILKIVLSSLLMLRLLNKNGNINIESNKRHLIKSRSSQYTFYLRPSSHYA